MGGAEVVWLLAIGAGLYFWNLGKAAQNLIYTPGNFTGIELQGVSPVVHAEIIVQNTNNASFTLYSIAGNVFSNGTLIGNISNFSPVLIAGNSQTVVPLTLVLQPVTLVNEIIQIITGGVGQREFKIDGRVNANGFQDTFSIDYKLGV